MPAPNPQGKSRPPGRAPLTTEAIAELLLAEIEETARTHRLNGPPLNMRWSIKSLKIALWHLERAAKPDPSACYQPTSPSQSSQR